MTMLFWDVVCSVCWLVGSWLLTLWGNLLLPNLEGQAVQHSSLTARPLQMKLTC